MRTPYALGIAVAALITLTGAAAGASYQWTDQDVTFLLEVDRPLPDLVTASLVVDTSLDPSSDFLHAVSVKVFPGEVPGGTLAAGAPWFFQEGASGPASVYPGLGTGPANSGFVSALYNGLTGVDVSTGGPSTFDFSWNTTAIPLAAPSIKALTVRENGRKSRQWSSGELTVPNPEPGTLALLAVGLAAMTGGLVRRRRRSGRTGT